ncbi:MAG: nucleoside deaminase [Acidobacteria bacterium]|nr:nucleoside deaminase [Acidobacteriota bacterium]
MGKIFPAFALLFLLFQPFLQGDEQKGSTAVDILEIEKRINSYSPDRRYPDDAFILVTVQEALAAFKEHNGGVGACLVQESTGQVVERGHNRQFNPIFRSDLHAEMDLLTRYEERVKARRADNPTAPQTVQRKYDGMVLYTSVEPCPMCLSRIINARLKKVYYAVADPTGGMAQKIQNLPVFWQELAAGSAFEPAGCSPELSALARALFHPSGKK